MGKTSSNKSGPPRVIGRNGNVRCCTEEWGYSYTYRNANCGLNTDVKNAATGYLY